MRQQARIRSAYMLLFGCILFVGFMSSGCICGSMREDVDRLRVDLDALRKDVEEHKTNTDQRLKNIESQAVIWEPVMEQNGPGPITLGTKRAIAFIGEVTSDASCRPHSIAVSLGGKDDFDWCVPNIRLTARLYEQGLDVQTGNIPYRVKGWVLTRASDVSK